MKAVIILITVFAFACGRPAGNSQLDDWTTAIKAGDKDAVKQQLQQLRDLHESAMEKEQEFSAILQPLFDNITELLPPSTGSTRCHRVAE